MRLYDKTWMEIPEQDRPAEDEVFVCRVTEGREASAVGECGYAVAVMGDGSLEHDLVRRGLFWSRYDAELFARCLTLAKDMERSSRACAEEKEDRPQPDATKCSPRG